MENLIRFFAAACLTCLLTLTGFTQGGTTGSLTWSLSVGGDTLTIYGSGTMADYTPATSPWYPYESSITTVIIGDSVKNIGNCAFSGGNYTYAHYRNLTSVSIGDSVASIGNGAFWGSGLTSITIPNSVITIDVYAFYECKSLTTLNIGSGITSIGGFAFSDCMSMSYINITAVVPPVTAAGAFFWVPLDASVNVPCGSETAYRDTTGQSTWGANGMGWCRF